VNISFNEAASSNIVQQREAESRAGKLLRSYIGTGVAVLNNSEELLLLGCEYLNGIRKGLYIPEISQESFRKMEETGRA
jgi:hypothetical protein